MPFTAFRALLGSTTGLRADDKMELKRDKQGAPSLSNVHNVHCPPGRPIVVVQLNQGAGR